jgi:hypothetical protein
VVRLTIDPTAEHARPGGPDVAPVIVKLVDPRLPDLGGGRPRADVENDPSISTYS